MTQARDRVLAAIAGAARRLPKSALAALAGCSTGVIDGLVADGALVSVALPPEPVAPPLDPDFRPTRLDPDQRVGGGAISAAASRRAPSRRPCSKASPARARRRSISRRSRRRCARAARRSCCCPRSR